MQLNLQNKVAIVGASSKGLGRACAEMLASEGVNLTLFSRTRADISNTAKELSDKYKVQVLPLQADASNPKHTNKVITQTIKKFKKIDILVNNSGGPPFGYLEEFNL